MRTFGSMFTLSNLHEGSGLMVLVAFAVKVCLQIYLDQAHDRAKGWQAILFFPLTFMTPYRGKVSAENLGLKNLCNLMFYTCIISLCVNLVVGILEYQTK